MSELIIMPELTSDEAISALERGDFWVFQGLDSLTGFRLGFALEDERRWPDRSRFRERVELALRIARPARRGGLTAADTLQALRRLAFNG